MISAKTKFSLRDKVTYANSIVKFCLITSSFILINQLLNWPFLKFWNIAGIDSRFNRFNDLSIVLEAARCYPLYGNLVYLVDFSCGNYLYGRALLEFISLFSLYNVNLFLGGLALAFSFIITTSYITKDFLLRGQLTVMLCVFCAPPFHLMVQRGHIDILIFSTLVISIYLQRKNHEYLSLFLIFLTVIIKFYTLFLLVYFALTKQSTRVRLTSILFLFLSISIIRTDLSLTSVKAGREYTGLIWGLFGWRTIIDRINQTKTFEMSNSLSILLSITIVFFLYISTFLLMKHLMATKDVKLYKTESWDIYESFFVLSIVFVTCFFAGTNFDFRLYFGVIAGIVLITVMDLSSRARNHFIALLLFVSWLSFESGGLEIFGDFLVLFLVCIYLEVWRLLFFKRNTFQKFFA